MRVDLLGDSTAWIFAQQRDQLRKLMSLVVLSCSRLEMVGIGEGIAARGQLFGCQVNMWSSSPQSQHIAFVYGKML